MRQCYGIYAKERIGWDITASAPENIDITEPIYNMVSADNTLLYDLQLRSVKSSQKGLVYSDDISRFDNIWADFLLNDLALPLFSDRLKRFLDRKITEMNYLKWINVTIRGDNDTRKYYIPEFTKRLDVVDMEKCTLNDYDDSIIVPCFSYKKIEKYVLFHIPHKEEYLWRVPHGVNISDETRKEMINNHFAGIIYEKIRTSE
jgi:hypothetical protein